MAIRSGVRAMVWRRVVFNVLTRDLILVNFRASQITDEVTCSIMERNDTLFVLMNLVKVAVCGSGG
jgi:hypothetical protein